ncbi:MAG: fibronectin type III domain-containing protein, partial [Planktomarina sp.]|nr:fibronectin type III domain-containing protein [Planktomarina sp.]
AAFAPATTSSPVTITGLTSGTAYTIGLRAVNGVGAGTPSATVAVTTLTTPNAPTGLSATPGNNKALINFTLPTSEGGSPINNYEYTLNGGTNWTAFAPKTITSPVTISGLTNETTYTISIRAINTVGSGATSENVTVTPIPEPTTASAPTALSATPRDTQITVEFTVPKNDGGSAITNYEYTFDDGTSWTAFSPNITESPANIIGLVNNTEYTIKLRAVNGVGMGSRSLTSVTATPTNGLRPPTAPTNLSASPGANQVEVEFTTPQSDGGSAITNYEYTTDNGTSWTAFSPNITESPVTLNTLTNGTTYTIGLRAVNAVGPGTKSETSVTATPLSRPNAPTGFTAAAEINATGGDGQLNINFIPPANPTGAAISNYQYSLDGGWSWVAFNPAITASPAQISGLKNGVEYTIELRALNAVGPGAASQKAKATPLARPNEPTNLNATINGTELDITFTRPSNIGGTAVTNYEYSIDEGTTWTAFNPAVTNSPVSITDLTVGTNYLLKLRAVNAAGSGAPSETLNFLFGTPKLAFNKNKPEILNMIVGDETRSLQSLMFSNQKIMQGARTRFIFRNKKNNSNYNSDKKANQLAFASTNNQTNLCETFLSCGIVDLEVDGSAQLSGGVFSTNGTISDQSTSKDGLHRRLIFGDFDIQHDSKSGSTISTFNGKALWEKMLSERTMFGSFLGLEQANSNIAGDFTGERQSWGQSLGGYLVHQFNADLYADALLAYYRGNKSIDVTNGALDLKSEYSSWTASYSASLTGVVRQKNFEIWPELKVHYGNTSIGNINFNANAYNQIDDTLNLDAGSVEIIQLMLRPETRVPVNVLGFKDNLSLITFAPRLICENIVASAPTRQSNDKNCGQGAEYGLAGRSEDGLTEFTGKIVIDTIGVNTRTSINVNLGYQF